jgi:hypothetical protein
MTHPALRYNTVSGYVPGAGQFSAKYEPIFIASRFEELLKRCQTLASGQKSGKFTNSY